MRYNEVVIKNFCEGGNDEKSQSLLFEENT